MQQGTIPRPCNSSIVTCTYLGSGDGQVVSVFAFNSENPSSIPTEVWIFYSVVNFLFSKLCEKIENKQKEAGDGPFFKKTWTYLKTLTRALPRPFVCVLVETVLRVNNGIEWPEQNAFFTVNVILFWGDR